MSDFSSSTFPFCLPRSVSLILPRSPPPSSPSSMIARVQRPNKLGIDRETTDNTRGDIYRVRTLV